jgi:LDH2 family malate/lactate/ureidoglycolate dehydrogenase
MAIEAISGVRCRAEALEPFIAGLLAAAGADRPSADAVARSVVDASSRGFDTHGVRLAPWYVTAAQNGHVNCRPEMTFERKAPAVGHIDADLAFGHLASYRAIEEGCAIARETGAAVITVGRSSHHGATGCYTLAAAREGFAALGMSHANAMVVPFGGQKPFFGTNPLSFAVPAPGEEPILLDMATSSIPFNRVMLRRATGTRLPPEVAVDGSGRATLDPNEARAVRPLGGADFGYKGAGLASMIDLLCSAFTGMQHGATIEAAVPGAQPIRIGHFFLILHPASFQLIELFDARIGAFLRDLRAQPAAAGEKVMAPGDPEKAEAETRARDGIPIDLVTWGALRRLADTLHRPVPEATEP